MQIFCYKTFSQKTTKFVTTISIYVHEESSYVSYNVIEKSESPLTFFTLNTIIHHQKFKSRF